MSAIGSIPSATALQPAAKVSATPAVAPGTASKDTRNDGDADDVSKAAPATAAPQPVTNSLGQLIGQNLHVTG